mmetsp:Transcript_24477/g.51053  ORF Transcript_24477/g.51053 Transcript_24477/m.51053 type:complete len:234 (-) Transcript_24477:898-1599(-)
MAFWWAVGPAMDLSPSNSSFLLICPSPLLSISLNRSIILCPFLTIDASKSLNTFAAPLSSASFSLLFSASCFFFSLILLFIFLTSFSFAIFLLARSTPEGRANFFKPAFISSGSIEPSPSLSIILKRSIMRMFASSMCTSSLTITAPASAAFDSDSGGLESLAIAASNSGIVRSQSPSGSMYLRRTSMSEELNPPSFLRPERSSMPVTSTGAPGGPGFVLQRLNQSLGLSKSA